MGEFVLADRVMTHAPATINPAHTSVRASFMALVYQRRLGVNGTYLRDFGSCVISVLMNLAGPDYLVKYHAAKTCPMFDLGLWKQSLDVSAVCIRHSTAVESKSGNRFCA